VREVCNYFNIKPTQLKGTKRDAALVKARHICMYLLKEKLGLTHVEIGNLLGGRDHTTIMHGVEKIGIQKETINAITEDIQSILNELESR
jgi:chromosomal replication initiator protein